MLLVRGSTNDANTIRSGLFGLFAVLMLATQIHLILLNQTVVESMLARMMKDREQETLADAFRWWEYG